MEQEILDGADPEVGEPAPYLRAHASKPRDGNRVPRVRVQRVFHPTAILLKYGA